MVPTLKSMTDADASYIITKAGRPIGFVGPDAMKLCEAIDLQSSLRVNIILMRRARIMTVLAKMHAYTGKDYKHAHAKKALADLAIWILAMKAALPIIEIDAHVLQRHGC